MTICHIFRSAIYFLLLYTYKSENSLQRRDDDREILLKRLPQF